MKIKLKKKPFPKFYFLGILFLCIKNKTKKPPRVSQLLILMNFLTDKSKNSIFFLLENFGF